MFQNVLFSTDSHNNLPNGQITFWEKYFDTWRFNALYITFTYIHTRTRNIILQQSAVLYLLTLLGLQIILLFTLQN